MGGGVGGGGGGGGDVDVDTLNPNLYSISINDGPAEIINVGERRRLPSAWPFKVTPLSIHICSYIFINIFIQKLRRKERLMLNCRR